jgi:hypothetical protein
MTHIPSPSAIMPSSEMHFFDASQSHIFGQDLAINTGINATFPSPPDFQEESGVLKTYGPSTHTLSDETKQTGVFHYNGLTGIFSNASTSKENSITDFTIYNAYIHHERYQISDNKDITVAIPYMSTFTVSIQYDPYGL